MTHGFLASKTTCMDDASKGWEVMYEWKGDEDAKVTKGYTVHVGEDVTHHWSQWLNLLLFR